MKIKIIFLFILEFSILLYLLLHNFSFNKIDIFNEVMYYNLLLILACGLFFIINSFILKNKKVLITSFIAINFILWIQPLFYYIYLEKMSHVPFFLKNIN